MTGGAEILVRRQEGAQALISSRALAPPNFPVFFRKHTPPQAEYNAGHTHKCPNLFARNRHMAKKNYRNVPIFVIKAASMAEGAGKSQELIEHYSTRGNFPAKYAHLLKSEGFKAARTACTV